MEDWLLPPWVPLPDKVREAIRMLPLYPMWWGDLRRYRGRGIPLRPASGCVHKVRVAVVYTTGPTNWKHRARWQCPRVSVWITCWKAGRTLPWRHAKGKLR